MSIADPSYLLERVALDSRPQRWLRVSVLAGGVGLVVLTWVHGTHHPLLGLLGVVVVAQAAVLPETHAPLLAVLYLAGLWLVATDGTLDPATLAAAVLLLVVHLAATLLAHGPPGLVPDRRLWLAWRPRAALCLAAAAGSWLLGRALGALDTGAGRLALGAALVLLLGWCVVVTLRVAWTHERAP